jgi:hypothetical protein
VAKHVRMRLELKACAGGGTLDHSGKAGGREWGSALTDEDEGRRRTLAVEPTQCPKLVADQRVRARSPVLDPPHVKHSPVEVDLVPAQVADLGRPQPVTKGEQDNTNSPQAGGRRVSQTAAAEGEPELNLSALG